MGEVPGGPGPEDRKISDEAEIARRQDQPGWMPIDEYIDEDGRTRFDSQKAREATLAMAENEESLRDYGVTKTNAEALASTEKAAPGFISEAEVRNQPIKSSLDMALGAETRDEAIQWLDRARASKVTIERHYVQRATERADVTKTKEKEEKLADLRRQIAELEAT